MSESIADRVKRITVEQLGVNPEQVKPEARFVEELLADSLDLVELVMALEAEFGIEVDDGEWEKATTVGKAVAFFESLVKK